MSPLKQRRARLGRPPLGENGEKVSDYPQVLIRLPPQTKALLDALSGVTGTPIWRLVDQAVAAYVRHLPGRERRLLAGVHARRAATKGRLK
jgi:hypothetical protein